MLSYKDALTSGLKTTPALTHTPTPEERANEYRREINEVSAARQAQETAYRKVLMDCLLKEVKARGLTLVQVPHTNWFKVVVQVKCQNGEAYVHIDLGSDGCGKFEASEFNAAYLVPHESNLGPMSWGYVTSGETPCELFDNLSKAELYRPISTD